MPERSGSTISSAAGTRLRMPMLSCGQAWTQSRQNVQSMLPTLRGWNRASSQPRWMMTRSDDILLLAPGLSPAPTCVATCEGSRAPRMQSLVWHETQTFASRTWTSRGESVEAMKLNWPIGQTNLQNEACLKTPSTTRTARKYARISQAVHHGDDQRSNSSYVKRMSTKRATAIHLLRSHWGQLRRGRRKRRAALRTAMN